MNREYESIEIVAPKGEGYKLEKWRAEYRVIGEGDARIIQINSLSSITVVVSKVLVDWYASIGLPPYYSYYVSIPNFNAATEGYDSLQLEEYFVDDLISRGMPKADAQTVAQVLYYIAPTFERDEQ